MSDLELIKSEISKVPINSRGRRKYPEAVKSLALKLHGQGMSFKNLADATGVHATTLHYWQERKKSKNGFKEIKIKRTPVSPKIRSVSVIEIIFDSGAKVSGLSFLEISELLRQEILK